MSQRSGDAVGRRTQEGARQWLLAAVLFAAISQARASLARVAVIGDYGFEGNENKYERMVMDMIKSWEPLDAVVTTGDNNYRRGDRTTMEANVGQYLHTFIHPYKSYTTPPAYSGSAIPKNRLFPCPGNKDWGEAIPGSLYTYLDFFPGIMDANGIPSTYYSTRVSDNIEFFMLDSDLNEDQPGMFGTSPDGIQGQWLKQALADSTADWKVVVFHNPAWGAQENSRMQWPYFEMGAHAVISGHIHLYQRFYRTEVGASGQKCQDFPYYVNGLGGAKWAYPRAPNPGTQRMVQGTYGAQLLYANSTTLRFTFIDATTRAVRDCVDMVKARNACGFKHEPCFGIAS